ncbi:hypothetical protein CRG98_017731 [Punica granatum]|uniref:Integrase catalytic domain-containing protein n=1 Tax=Punica granatum TaxID=22663 RepID=A0A2I0K184_PUNGR|nr:hypothetical protein CRG98_017731 [Punica granatum]
MQIEDYLYGKDLWQPLENKPIGMTDAEWNVLDRKAMSVIRLLLSRNVAFHTAKEKNTKESIVVAEHLNEFNLKTAQLTSVDIDFDDEKRVSFLKAGRTLKEQKLELVHSDLWGPAPVTSLGGASYYMTFIDDSTRKALVLKR